MKMRVREETATFSTRGQIVIPRRIRKEFGIEEGTRTIIYEDGDTIVLKPVTPRHIRNLRGSLKGTGVLQALMEDRKRERNL